MRRLLTGLFCLAGSIAIVASTTGSYALDIHPDGLQNKKELKEATRFFEQLAKSTHNPLIAHMATDSLNRLKNGNEALERTVTEVRLLPQPDNTFVVPTLLNKRMLATFLVDTGASYTVITPQTAEALGLELEDTDNTVPVTTANGIIQAPLINIPQLSLGRLKVKNVPAVVADLGENPQLAGLLGMSFFQGMEISFRQDKLIISR